MSVESNFVNQIVKGSIRTFNNSKDVEGNYKVVHGIEANEVNGIFKKLPANLASGHCLICGEGVKISSGKVVPLEADEEATHMVVNTLSYAQVAYTKASDLEGKIQYIMATSKSGTEVAIVELTNNEFVNNNKRVGYIKIAGDDVQKGDKLMFDDDNISVVPVKTSGDKAKFVAMNDAQEGQPVLCFISVETIS